MIDKYKCPKVKGVECKVKKEDRDCDVCIYNKGIGIVPIIHKEKEE